MSFPVIIVDSATGSDSAASGAGPGDGTTSGSALTGSAASTDGAGTVVTLDGSPSLADVATDGSHVIYLSTGSGRKFGKITAKDDTAKTVTVADAFGLSLSGLSWAIGGKRASVFGSTASRQILTGTPDAKAGWVVEMLSGHSEVNSARRDVNVSGNTTDGPFILRGRPGAATMPLITSSANDINVLLVDYCQAWDFEVRNSNATKTASYGIYLNGKHALAHGIVCNHATDKFNIGVLSAAASNTIRLCSIANTASHGIQVANGAADYVVDNRINSCGGCGVYVPATDSLTIVFERNEIRDCTSDGLQIAGGSGDNRGMVVRQNTFANNGANGLKLTSTDIPPGSEIVGNLITGNGAYGINFSGAGVDIELLSARMIYAKNATYGNTSGSCNISGILVDDPNIDPNYVSSSDLTPQNTSLAGACAMWPDDYIYPGAIQPQASGGGGGGGGPLIGGRLVL